MTRQHAQQLAQSLGALPQHNASKTIDFVIAGRISKSMDQELTTKKLQYAQAHKIQVLNEHDFLTWCNFRTKLLCDTVT
ncbi:hypothetical protein FC65_GL000416 [Ligilactobacillus acidipiscis DSM 15836]|uniref:BRCT domain-containing protein n=2 Tax=Ligilactobacillus acidipiscis TaxID=89059 RepID=A0ABR5PIT3_9LACO|nr:hypothetical protein FC65_GL000416 [Ligilactobacillus acidipiscis DSM 15836]